MTKHKSEDYKLSAVKYYLNNDVSLHEIKRYKRTISMITSELFPMVSVF